MLSNKEKIKETILAIASKLEIPHEDIEQQIYLAILNNEETCKKSKNPWGYLYRCVYNDLLEYISPVKVTKPRRTDSERTRQIKNAAMRGTFFDPSDGNIIKQAVEHDSHQISNAEHEQIIEETLNLVKDSMIYKIAMGERYEMKNAEKLLVMRDEAQAIAELTGDSISDEFIVELSKKRNRGGKNLTLN